MPEKPHLENLDDEGDLPTVAGSADVPRSVSDSSRERVSPPPRKKPRDLAKMLLEKYSYLEGSDSRNFAIGTLAQEVTPSALPASIGPYEIIEKLGEGGFGVVYSGKKPGSRSKEVAIKLMRVGKISKELVARFDAEKNALQGMDSVHIARFLDWDVTDDGRPYFVMERVAGVPITTYCDEHQLSIAERLKLFNQVCRGVEHAHNRGIMHRDLKPANILVSQVDGVATAKVIDFGLAKSLAGTLTDKTLVTGEHQLLGTPAYMSPEQVESGTTPIDSKSDVYSLGVLLYEMLTDELPHDLLGIPTMKALNKITTEEPLRPSERLRELHSLVVDQIASRRGSQRLALISHLEKELDWIVLKALKVVSVERYATPLALAEDIECHLRGERVLARPPSAGYRLQKFVGRYRGPLAAAALVFVALVGGITWALVEKGRADRGRATMESAVVTLFGNLTLIDEETASEQMEDALLRRHSEALQGQQPAPGPKEVQALNDVLKTSLSAANFTDIARGTFHEMVGIPITDTLLELFREDPEVAKGVIDEVASLAEKLLDSQNYQQAAAMYERLVELSEIARGQDDGDTVSYRLSLAEALIALGDLGGAEAIYRGEIDRKMESLGPDHPDTQTIFCLLAIVLEKRGDDKGAEVLLREALVVFEKNRETTVSRRSEAKNNLAVILKKIGKFQEAGRLLEEVLSDHEEATGIGSPDWNLALHNLGAFKLKRGDFEEAVDILREVLSWCVKNHSPDHERTLITRNQLAKALTEMGDLEGGEKAFRQVLEARVKKAEKPNDTAVLITRYFLAKNLLEQQRFEEAIEGLELVIEGAGDGSKLECNALFRMAIALRDSGQDSAALEILERCYDCCQILGAPYEEKLADTVKFAIDASARLGDEDAAIIWQQRQGSPTVASDR